MIWHFLLWAIVLAGIFVWQYKRGEKAGRKDERGRVEGIFHAAILVRMSPTLRIVWASVRGEYTREELQNRLQRLPVPEDPRK